MVVEPEPWKNNLNKIEINKPETWGGFLDEEYKKFANPYLLHKSF